MCYFSVCYFFFFFFSSRRRHTRCSRDWSSDVCSSDLQAIFHQVIIGARMHSAHGNVFTNVPGHDDRSEEHTSELQSRLHLVCRLLLEKKKTKRQTLQIQYTMNTLSTLHNRRE